MRLSKEVKELRGKVQDRLEKLDADIGEGIPTAEQEAEFTKLKAERDALDAELVHLSKAAEDAAARRQFLSADAPDVKAFNVNTGRHSLRKPTDRMSNDEVCHLSQQVLQAWSNPLAADSDQIEQSRALGFDPFGKELRLSLMPTHEIRQGKSGIQKFAQGISQISTGGALIMPMFTAELETALLAYGGLRQYAKVIRTSKSTEIPYPTLNSTSLSATIVGEAGTVPAASVTFGQVKMRAFKYTPGYFPVSRELLRDSEFDMGAILGGVMGESIARGQAAHFISGNGATQPMGLLTASTSGKTAAATTAVTISEIRDLIASVDPAYRPFSSLIMHDNTRIALMELKGGDGHYLWQPDLTKGAPLTFDGYPVVIDNSMASSLAASGKPIAFGVLNKYAIRDVNTIRIQRLTELHALTDQDSFVAFMETDANLLNAGTNPVKYLTMAAA